MLRATKLERLLGRELEQLMVVMLGLKPCLETAQTRHRQLSMPVRLRIRRQQT
jgi:hypothetical protein